MRLTAFKVQGFKSFADSAGFKLGGELTGIVGPNGCGKSNVIDAIRWTLGEARTTSLRVNNFSDYLFSGNEKRGQADWCEVELHFKNEQAGKNAGGSGGGMWGWYADIVVRREYSRDEKQKFSINGAAVRRRDVLDLFRGSGVSPRAYGVIEQGMVSHVADSSPEELRAFIEESANISQYKARRHETQNRLSAARENLRQVSLILEEQRKSENTLKRQARISRKYRELEAAAARLKILILLTEKERNGQLLAAAQTQIGEWQQGAEKAEAQAAQGKTVVQEKNAQLRQARAALETLTQKQMGIKTRAAERRRDIENAAQRRAAAQTLLADSRGEAAQVTAQIEKLQARAAEIAEELTQLQKARTAQQQKVATSDAQRQGLQAAQTQAAAQVQTAQAKLNESEKNYESAAVRRQMFAEQLKTLGERIKHAQAALAGLEIDDGTAADLSGEQAQIAQLQARIAEHKKHEQALAAKTEDNSRQMREQENELTGLRAELKVTTDLLEEEYQEVVGHKRLAQALELQNSDWALALDAALGIYANALVAEDLAAHLRDEGVPTRGHAVVELKASAGAPARNEAVKLETLSAALGLDAEQGGEAAFIQNWLSGVYVAKNEKEVTANRPRLRHGEAIVSRDGTVYQAHSVFRLNQARGGFDWQSSVNKLNDAIAAAETAAADLKSAADKLRRDTDAAAQDGGKMQGSLDAAQQRLVERKIELNRREERRHSQLARQKELEQTLVNLREEQAQIQQQQSEIGALGETQEKAKLTLVEAVGQAQRALVAADTALEDWRRDNEAENKKLVDTAHAHQRTHDEGEQTRQRLAEFEQSREHIKKRMAEGQSELARADEGKLKAQLAEDSKAETAMEAEIAAQRGRVSAAENEIAELTDGQEKTRADIEALQKRIADKRLEERELSIAASNAAEEIARLTPPAEVLAEFEKTPFDEAVYYQWQTELTATAEKQGKLGAINFAAEEDLRECQEKIAGIEAQVDDINSAIGELTDVIAHIDGETKTRLQTVYETVNREFNALFVRLFGGGEARLDMTEDDILTAHFELKVRPPGKRQFPVRMLSGGEKAASAIAFIFAMMRLNPPPFCLLDEVDAMMDEQRTDKFIDLLQEISAGVQCLIISHNKATISTMKRLIGVTQEETGVSKIVAVTLEDALRQVR